MSQGTFPFLIPALVATVALVLLPVLYTIWLSVTDQDIAGNNSGFVGFDNFVLMFQNSEFWYSLFVTLQLFVVCLVVETVLGLALGYLLSRDVPGRAIFQGLLLIPAITASVAVALVWMLIYDPTLGAANQLLTAIGLDPVVWLGSREMAPWSIAIVDIWQWTPFMALIISAGIRSLPSEPFEAASIDGAGPVKKALFVGLPLLRSVLLVAMLLRTVDLIRFFDTIYIMTQGGPVNATNTLNVYGYRAAFIDQEPSYAAALQLSLFVLVILIAAIFTVVRKRSTDVE
ncbi:carbohydrate ABC transporter permease [Paramicrobacterium agarici]|uniref:Carbohydrate ABC transporter membrane protein 1 (CUT1 family) n=1 Tax=Paramicrobacterium agarici TaxID=630514 RepID=A0A2A9DU49_9MICO|nr:sugar ABC transporter permease [Microbacterium agarici]PFG29901.1 carbohydrate ABC transporter membrane protein 1 (CUT1 family) [Microbacterium agarici]TQO22901.1 carbohydrate ABC transporter membrane protein 1 (CUT1 family) [Microbacterium agarici]